MSGEGVRGASCLSFQVFSQPPDMQQCPLFHRETWSTLPNLKHDYKPQTVTDHSGPAPSLTLHSLISTIEYFSNDMTEIIELDLAD